MDTLSSSFRVVSGRLAFPFFGDSRIQAKRGCNFGFPSSKTCVAALSNGILSAGLPESLAQLQLELTHYLGALGLPLAADAGESSIWWATAAAPLAWWYLSAAPGSIGGLLDYASTPLHSHSAKSFNAEEVEVGRLIGQGSFGVVYEGYIGRRGKRKETQTKEVHVILKKVKPGIRGAAEMHATEEYMNRRVQRTAPNACAEYLGTTLVSRSQTHGRLTEGLWLIWKFEGGRTLDYYLKQRDFPDNVGEYILVSKMAKEKPRTKAERLEQSNALIRRIMFQILTSLRDLHRTGLVHRDVKPLNLVLAEDEGTFKLVDLGACVDIRSGYNYVPEETVIDPTYAAPEHHIMPTSTPELPSDPLCSLISPFVWALNTPDRFDLYSALSFNTELKRAGYDLEKWRRKCRFSDEDFELLDADGGAGWELVKAMVQPRHDKELTIWPSIGSSRPSAEAALKHRFFSRSFIKLPTFKAPFTLSSSVFSNLKDKEAKGSTKPAVVPEVGGAPKPVFVPAIHSNVATKLNPVQPQLEFDSSEIVRAIGALTQPALAVGASWLVLSGLRSSAQATYALGQSLVQSVGISGMTFVAFFVIIKPWLEAQKGKHTTDEGHMSRNARAEVDLDLEIDVDQKPSKSASTEDARTGTLLTTMHRHSAVERPSQAGLKEALRDMEVQLASLEASIFVEREFAKQQHQRILQMEKLLIRTPPPSVSTEFKKLEENVQLLQ